MSGLAVDVLVPLPTPDTFACRLARAGRHGRRSAHVPRRRFDRRALRRSARQRHMTASTANRAVTWSTRLDAGRHSCRHRRPRCPTRQHQRRHEDPWRARAPFFTLDPGEVRPAGRRHWERPVAQTDPSNLGASGQAAELPGERWPTPAIVAANKLMIPRSRRPLVPRPGLSARLDESYRLALVSAPAGYGKTAALAMWAAEQGDRVAWLSCDRSDAEPTRFMSGLLSAISARWPGVADDAFVLLERDSANTYDDGSGGGERARHHRCTGRGRGGRPSSGCARSGSADRVHRGVAPRFPFRRRYPVGSAVVAGPAASARRPVRAACRRSQLRSARHVRVLRPARHLLERR